MAQVLANGGGFQKADLSVRGTKCQKLTMNHVPSVSVASIVFLDDGEA